MIELGKGSLDKKNVKQFIKSSSDDFFFMSNIVEIKNIIKDYAKHRALNDVSLNIPKGSIYGLLGPNGAGKTSLIRILNQITAPDEGKVLFNGEELNPSHIEKIGYLPEERGLYKKMKVGEQLLYLARLKGLSKKEATLKIKTWLTRLELQHWWDKDIDSLSKGMQQKVQFISTVMHQPELIILDEPFSGFDPINANLIKDEILKLRDEGATIIFSTHRMESVEELCDYICLINKSQKIVEGKLVDIKKENRTNQYKIVIESKNNDWESELFEIVSFESNEGKQTLTIRYKDEKDQAKIYSYFSNYGWIESFSEIIPTANDIFINKVSQQDG